MVFKIQTLRQSPLFNDCLMECIGVKCASEEEHIYVPNGNWLTKKKIYSAEMEIDFSNAVTLLNVNPSIRLNFKKKILPALKDKQIDKKLLLSHFYKLVESELKSYSNIINTSLYNSYELVYNPPGSLYTGFDYSKKKLIGLHIDVHESLPVTEAFSGFSLLNINIGDCERYFYFVDLTPLELLKKVDISLENTDKIYNIAHYNLKNKFFEKFPNYPILRLKILPDQAYIATTQAIIHDGGVNTMGFPDFTFLIPGKFKCIH